MQCGDGGHGMRQLMQGGCNQEMSLNPKKVTNESAAGHVEENEGWVASLRQFLLLPPVASWL